MAGGNPQPALTVLEIMPTGGGPYAYGLDRYGNQLFVSMSYAGEAQSFGSLGMNMLTPVSTWSMSTLPEPHADLEEVWSVARSGDGRTFFAWGDFHTGVNGSGIMQQTMGGVWSMFNDGMNLWSPPVDGVMITVGMVAGTEVLIASSNDKLYKFRTSDGQLLAEYVVEPVGSRDLEIDGQGRLWYGTQSGVYAFDVTDDNMIVELARRGGVPCGRMALREQPPVIHVYCVSYRDAAIIGHLTVEL
jgi:hypothetical protein